MATVKKIKTWQWQAALWVVALLFSFLANLPYDPPDKSLYLGALANLFDASIIYANVYWLIPSFYEKKKLLVYVALTLLVLGVSVEFRSNATVLIQNLPPARKIQLKANLVYTAFTALWTFLFSILCRVAINYFALIRKQNEIKSEKAQSELNLLKQQVHPHFLFNTLNNIYYVTQKKSPEAADLIERLSGIIRYFMEESEKERVFLKDEIDLLNSYIELESIRMQHEMKIEFLITGSIDAITLPPLLLLPLVENIFKHGIDRRSKDNYAKLNLTIDNNQLSFKTQNRCSSSFQPGVSGNGTGLANLEKRLKLYYDQDYQLTTQKNPALFLADLKIPVYEH